VGVEVLGWVWVVRGFEYDVEFEVEAESVEQLEHWW